MVQNATQTHANTKITPPGLIFMKSPEQCEEFAILKAAFISKQVLLTRQEHRQGLCET